MGIVSQMSKKLPTEWIKTVSFGNRSASYVPIDKVIFNLNEKFKDAWNIEVCEMHTVPGHVGFVVTVKLTIVDNNKESIRFGVGADIHKPSSKTPNAIPDPDKLIKTAYANAIKKAANMYGFGLELWDESNVHDEAAPVQETAPVTHVPAQPAQPAAQTPVQQAAPVQNTAPKPGLSDISREKVSVLLKDTGLMRNELTEYLKSLYPDSQGNPAFLTIGDENQNVDDFVAKVRADIANKKVPV